MTNNAFDIEECTVCGERLPPSTIITMLICYYSPDPESEIDPDRWNSTVGQDTRKWLRDQGLIDADHSATERGQAWVEYICRTPLPEQQWVLPDRMQKA